MKKYHNKVFNNSSKVADLPAMQCIPPKSFFQQINFTHIDIWILGNQGNDESVIRGTDFSTVNINSIVFECDGEDSDRDQGLISLVEKNGFKCQSVFPNCFCKNNKYAPKAASGSLMSPPNLANDPHKRAHHAHRNETSSSKLMNAVTVRYPYAMFEEKKLEWKTSVRLNQARIAEERLPDNPRKWSEGYVYSFAQDDEDVYLYENFFFGVENGVIMESGALDGKEFSNSAMFESYLNWTAIHVEADPDNYAKLLTNRPNAVNVNAALCSEPRLLVTHINNKLC
jgi:hypothetical protein